MEQAAQVVGVQAVPPVQVAWQRPGVGPVDGAPGAAVPGAAADKVVVARQDVPAVVVVEVPGAAVDRVVVNAKQIDWMPGVSDRDHSVCSKEFDLN